MRLVCLILVCATISGCGFVGDGLLRVKGKIVGKPESQLNNCFIRLQLPQNGQILYERNIKNVFIESFVINPRKDRYRFSFYCEGYKVYTTEEYVISGGDYRKDPLDFGIIVIEK